MNRDHAQIGWDQSLVDDLRRLLRLGLDEDLQDGVDLTTVALVPPDALGGADVVARVDGVVAGIATGDILFELMSSEVRWSAQVADGDRVGAGQRLAVISGPARDLLTGERTLLNVLCHLSGIATQTARYVEAIQGTKARLYDTRKTLPGWRRLQKYAVGCGGGRNHRSGLHDAVLIKDNHLCFGSRVQQRELRYGLKDAVRAAREYVSKTLDDGGGGAPPIVQIEVDSLEQLAQVLNARPEIVLLDNMSIDELRAAVSMRDNTAPQVALEASGGITLETLRDVAETGVDRISLGAMTHTVQAMDIALDWHEVPA